MGGGFHSTEAATPESVDSQDRVIKQEWPRHDLNGNLLPHKPFTDKICHVLVMLEV